MNDIFPNLKTRIEDVSSFNKQNYYMSNPEFLKFTGKNIGAHAEIRALDNLAKKRFGNNIPSDIEFDYWLKNDVLGYNRNIKFGVGQVEVIQHTCADCFHILDLVTFIKP